MRPLRLATLGLLRRTPLSVATEGHLGDVDEPGPEPTPPPGGGRRRRRRAAAQGLTTMDLCVLAYGAGLAR